MTQNQIGRGKKALVAKNNPGARLEVKNATLDVLRDGAEMKMGEILEALKDKGWGRERILRALKDLEQKDERVRQTRKGYWQRTSKDIMESNHGLEIQKWRDALAEAYLNGPYETMHRHSAQILSGLLYLSHYYGGHLENYLLHRDLQSMGMILPTGSEVKTQAIVSSVAGLDDIGHASPYLGMVKQHIRSGYPEAQAAIEEMEGILTKRKLATPEERKDLASMGYKIGQFYYMDEFDHASALELDYKLVEIVAEVMAGSIMKGECYCCPPVKGVLNKLQEPDWAPRSLRDERSS